MYWQVAPQWRLKQQAAPWFYLKQTSMKWHAILSSSKMNNWVVTSKEVQEWLPFRCMLIKIWWQYFHVVQSSTYCFNRQFTFFVLTDLRSTLPLGPATLVLLLLPEGRVLADGGLDGVLRAAGFFSARFFWDATLLFSLKLNDLLSWESPPLKSMCCPLFIRSR